VLLNFSLRRARRAGKNGGNECSTQAAACGHEESRDPAQAVARRFLGAADAAQASDDRRTAELYIDLAYMILTSSRVIGTSRRSPLA
jgi:hypothetical protein